MNKEFDLIKVLQMDGNVGQFMDYLFDGFGDAAVLY